MTYDEFVQEFSGGVISYEFKGFRNKIKSEYNITNISKGTGFGSNNIRILYSNGYSINGSEMLEMGELRSINSSYYSFNNFPAVTCIIYGKDYPRLKKLEMI